VEKKAALILEIFGGKFSEASKVLSAPVNSPPKIGEEERQYET